MVDKVCKTCKEVFSARQADINRGWAKFCSKSCKAKEQTKRTGGRVSYSGYDDDIGHPMDSGYFGHGQN